MAKCFHDDDTKLTPLEGRTVAVIGYGNQGRSQALNLRDSGVRIVVGNRDDAYADQARADGFEVRSIGDAAAAAEILMLVLPDEVQESLYVNDIEGNLRVGAAISFASGYNIHFGSIKPREDLDVVLVAPKMLGEFVRSHFLDGSGFPALVAVNQDVTGFALDIALALAKGIGATKRGAFLSTFEEETVTDLFGEQIGGAGLLGSIMFSFDTLVDAGFDPDVVALELYASGELGDVVKALCRDGLINSLNLHSPASRYGQLSRISRVVSEEYRSSLRAVLLEITSGSFANELSRVSSGDNRRIEELADQFRAHPAVQAEERIRLAFRDGELAGAPPAVRSATASSGSK